MVQLSHPYMTTGKPIALTIQTFVGKVMSFLFNRMSRFVIVFLPRSKHLLISWLQSPSTAFGAQENKVCHCFHCFPIYLPWTDRTGYLILVFWMLCFKLALGHVVTVFLRYYTQLFSKVATSFYNPINSVWLFQFLHILASTCYCLPFSLWSCWWVWNGTFGSLICIYLILMVLSIFSYAYCPFIYFSWRNVFKHFAQLKKNIYFFIFGCAGSLLLHGLFFSFGVWASHVGSIWTRNQTCVFCTGRQILYHWAIREAQIFCSVLMGLFVPFHYWGFGWVFFPWLNWVFIVVYWVRRHRCPAACGILVPRPGIKSVSPALTDGFLTTGPPGKPPLLRFNSSFFSSFIF